MLQRRGSAAAFTLIEVLVALAIVSVALLAALRAAGQGTNDLVDLRSRVLASWIAENRLAEHRARGAWLPLGIQNGNARQAGFDFLWREEVTTTPNFAFRRIDISVSPAGPARGPTVTLTAFLTAPEGQR